MQTVYNGPDHPYRWKDQVPVCESCGRIVETEHCVCGHDSELPFANQTAKESMGSHTRQLA